MPNLTNTTLGNYQLLELIGRGGMASVYKAFQPGVERFVAVKVLPAALADNQTFVERFNREARLLARLQHPHILPVFDFGQDRGVTYLVMPYIQSGTLADRLEGRPLSMTLIHRVARQLGDALDYAHGLGLVHRDIKPANVLMDEQGNCLLADFGIARLLEGDSGLTGTGNLMGTPAYMSPEQGRGERADHRSDIYALGVILYQMATGRVPFQGDTPIGVVLQHVRDDAPPPRALNPALSPRVEQVLLQALEKEPQRRFQKAGALVRALGAADAASVPPLPPRRPPDEVLPAAGGFNRRLFAGVALALVLLLAGGGALLRVLAQPAPTPTQLVAAGEDELPGEESGAAQQPPTSQPLASVTPDPAALAPAATQAPEPSATPQPTATPEPSATPSPTATADWRQGRLAFIISRTGAKYLYTQDLSAGGEPQLLYTPPGGTFLLGPSWSPDGQRIVVYDLGGQVLLVEAADGAVRASPQSCTSPSWSPDGAQLLCRASNPSTFRIFDSAGGTVERQVARPPSAVLPEWSPLGDEVAYALLDGDSSTIWRMSLQNELTQLLAGGGVGENYAPSWSPDGQWLAYQSRQGSANSEIWIVDRNGQNARRLTSTPPGSWSRAPSWSPDGQWIVFVSNQGDSLDAEHGEAFVVHVPSGAVERVTFTGGSVYNWRVDWGPSPQG